MQELIFGSTVLQVGMFYIPAPQSSGGAARLTAEEESDRISMKKTNYIKSTLLSLLKVCLYGCYTNCQFY